MNSQHRAIRAILQSMSPNRAEETIRAFRLPEEEELFLLEIDVRGLSYIQAAERFHTSPESIKRRRQRAYSKIVDTIAYMKEERRD